MVVVMVSQTLKSAGGIMAHALISTLITPIAKSIMQIKSAMIIAMEVNTIQKSADGMEAIALIFLPSFPTVL